MGLARDAQGEHGRMAELASGIDALYMSARAEISQGFLSDLEKWREQAGQSGVPVAIELGGEAWFVQPRSLGRYRFQVTHEFGVIGLTDSSVLPAMRFQPRAELLHAQGPTAAIGWFRDVASSVSNVTALTAARVDLFADWQGWDLLGDDRHAFITRAQRRDTHEMSEDWTGFEFGRRKTNTVMARLYDKTADVNRKGTDWWYEVWGDRFDRTQRVMRVEFEFGRQGLNQYGIDSPESAVELAPRLWRTVTDDWISHRSQGADRTRSRWPVSPQWKAVQGASFASNAIGLERARDGRAQGGLR